MEWINLCEEWKVPIVTAATIRFKCNEIRQKMQLENPLKNTKLDTLRFSNGWLSRFQARHGIKSRRTHGEAASVFDENVMNGRTTLQSITLDYPKRNVFNMDETAYTYCAAPTKTISKLSVPGRKLVKKRITVSLTSNGDGSCMPPLLFIGTANNPRCFKNRNVSDMDCEYTSTKKGWMTQSVFREWIMGFNEKMKQEDRHVLLLLDNASCHQFGGKLSNVNLKKLPPNTTAHLQPQDAGIIRKFKAKIEELKTVDMLKKFDELLAKGGEFDKENFFARVNKLHEVSLVQAMEWAVLAWREIDSKTVSNCWRHVNIFDEVLYELQGEMQKMTIHKD
ncbi:hypothetical protein AeMF1_014507 [Aphanomyces euteiches]|nr:hypothetical protein AeMF1_014507 [Aphanomyces euteiches]